MVEGRWTLGQLREMDKYLWSSCPVRTAMVTVDLDDLIVRLGEDFDVTGGALEAQVQCPCGGMDHRPYIGVGDRRYLRSAHTTPHDVVPIHQATLEQLERNRVARETNPRERQRHEQLQDELADIRAKKAKRRARNPYDFS